MARMRTAHATSLLSLALVAAASSAPAAEVTLDRSTTAQTIEGFGFFGAHDVWWGSDADMVSEDWVRLVIDDLGLSMWRNEYYPPADALNGQDADWDKQRPVVELFRDVARERGVPLKVLLTVWTPPAAMKCAVTDDVIDDGTPHPGGTKEGGALCPSQREAFAAWLLEGLDLYAEAGVDVYGLSFQNEPLFVEPYNSCVYTQAQYAETLAAIGPTIKAAYPGVKLFGSENMLEIECGRSEAGEFDPWWYTGTLLEAPDALSQLDAWAVHGYSDGVAATPTSKMATLWSEYAGAVRATGKPVWMTETSGYDDGWEAGELPGAIDLAQGIYAALRYGDASAWVWWQGSELDGPSEYGLMGGAETLSKRYHVSKQFYRFIRPGARRVTAESDDDEALVVAFDQAAMGALTLVAINVGAEEKPLTLAGAELPESFEVYRSSETEDCAALGELAADAIVLPPRSVTTLVSGNVYEDASGTGGAGGADGTGGGAGASAFGGATTTGGDDGDAGDSGLALGGGPTSGGGEIGGAATGGDEGDAGDAALPPIGGDAATGGTATGGDAGDAGDAGLALGGALATGGTTRPGGAPTTGGASSGGTTPATGAAANAGGGAAPEPTGDSNDDSGCGCVTAGSARTSWAWGLLLAALGLLRRERRGR